MFSLFRCLVSTYTLHTGSNSIARFAGSAVQRLLLDVVAEKRPSPLKEGFLPLSRGGLLGLASVRWFGVTFLKIVSDSILGKFYDLSDYSKN